MHLQKAVANYKLVNNGITLTTEEMTETIICFGERVCAIERALDKSDQPPTEQGQFIFFTERRLELVTDEVKG